MAVEIERKFLVNSNEWRSLAPGTLYRQGYIPTNPDVTVRVRLVGEQGYLTIKTPLTAISKAEYEYPIPLSDAQSMIDSACKSLIVEKYRHKIPFGGLVWEVDEFIGQNAGLILAEVEIPTEDFAVELPNWNLQEVSGDRRYYNHYLAHHPFQTWKNYDSKQSCL
ncbi:CYTH domain-containing protein [Merismopedia glauca]|uniref:Adenylate cyclase n=1 Tax=Merismopedia glauca CCAP 1448/3 TaxID=1296344 RepID=A0A2T1C905_9CYAN|nr:CYTH domain-containing protein [Merismopedia glauca]PSB04729.1 adenylate cyclase [Merismopedia glauca CCAP 1448/3]